MAAHAVGHGSEDVVLFSPDLQAIFVPQAGMVGRSLRHRGEELLGQGGGLAAYVERGSTFGIPLLYPWANRLSGFRYAAAGREVSLDPDSPLLHLDPNGLPIHGLWREHPNWELIDWAGEEGSARLTAQAIAYEDPKLFEAFPFPHELNVAIELRDDTLSIRTTLRATGDVAVPVSFGYHPYLCLPGVERADWEIAVPVGRRLLLDDNFIPTGESEPAAVEPGPLGERTFDDGYSDLADPAEFTLAGGGRRIAVRFDEGYPFAQVYAPPGQDLICFEPMTAPTNALVTDGPELRLVEPGKSFTAAFSITVAADSQPA